jgi:hypothetical protein
MDTNQNAPEAATDDNQSEGEEIEKEGNYY